MDRFFLKLSFGFYFIVICTVSKKMEPNLQHYQCLNTADKANWSRSFHFNNEELTLKLEVTNKPSHWIVNYIFGILAHERLGYRSIEFVEQPWDQPQSTLNRLACDDSECTKLPVVHINLEVWLPLGSTPVFWISPDKVMDNGPLGPASQWALMADPRFVDQLSQPFSSNTCSSNMYEPSSQSWQSTPGKCSIDLCNATTDLPKEILNSFGLRRPGKTARRRSKVIRQFENTSNMMVWGWYPYDFGTWDSSYSGGLRLPTCSNTSMPKYGHASSSSYHRWLQPEQVRTSRPSVFMKPNSRRHICRFESHQATKASWTKLKERVPLIYSLVDKMRFSQDEYDELVKSAEALDYGQGDKSLQIHYRNIACQWLRFNPLRWNSWTEGWNRKQNLTVAGLFAFSGKWVFPGLDRVAMRAIDFVNAEPSYFGNTEYALTLDVRNLSCSQDIVLNDYYELWTKTPNANIIGIIAAVCSDSIGPVVEMANLSKQIIVSPTVESARLAKSDHYPYFFRTVPSIIKARLVLIRLFEKWGWRRVAVLRKDDHFMDPQVYEQRGPFVIADNPTKENHLTFNSSITALNLMIAQKFRIFIVEYFAKSTALILCAAYRLGMHFDAGYVWFINPWLSGDWWAKDDILPVECTYEEMVNITTWTFTIGHQIFTTPIVGLKDFEVMDPQEMSSSLFRRKFRHRRSASDTQTKIHYGPDHDMTGENEDQCLFDSSLTLNKSNVLRNYPWSNDYVIHTCEAVFVLANALVHLLKQNPSALSVFGSPKVADDFARLIAGTKFSYSIFREFWRNELYPSGHGLENRNSREQEDEDAWEFMLRFDSNNERVADYWLLKQRHSNFTVPVLKWYLADNSTWEELILDSRGRPAEVGKTSEQFEQSLTEQCIYGVHWSKDNRPPNDGSETEEECTFGFLSRVLGSNCSNSAAIGSILIVLLIAGPFLGLFIFYYRRKLKEAERLIRQPYEDLCAELADIDIPYVDVVLNRRIGQGAFGMVYGGEAKRNGRWEAVAVKVIGSKANYVGKTDFLLEAKLMRSLDHRNVVRLVGICLYPKENHIYLIMEFMLYGDLKSYLLSRRVLAQRKPDDEDICPKTLTQMAIDIAEGLAYLHSKSLIHRDIACRNCLVGRDRVVKIGDFGLTRKVTSKDYEGYYRFTRNCELPIRWMPPEAVQFGIFSVYSDVWSFGIVLYEIITFGVFPYEGLGDVELVELIKRTEFSILKFLPPAARDSPVSALINQCCQHQWQNRPVSLAHIIQKLTENPGCVRPFLTDEPPKLNSTIDALPFQPGAGACIMSKNLLATGDPTPNNPTSIGVLAERLTNSHGAVLSLNSRGFTSNTGSLGGIGLSSLPHLSMDSFSDALTYDALRSFQDNSVSLFGRRRHKTAESAVAASRYQCMRKGTASSSGGHTYHSSEQSSDERSPLDEHHGAFAESVLPNWSMDEPIVSPKSGKARNFIGSSGDQKRRNHPKARWFKATTHYPNTPERHHPESEHLRLISFPPGSYDTRYPSHETSSAPLNIGPTDAAGIYRISQGHPVLSGHFGQWDERLLQTSTGIKNMSDDQFTCKRSSSEDAVLTSRVSELSPHTTNRTETSNICETQASEVRTSRSAFCPALNNDARFGSSPPFTIDAGIAGGSHTSRNVINLPSTTENTPQFVQSSVYLDDNKYYPVCITDSAKCPTSTNSHYTSHSSHILPTISLVHQETPNMSISCPSVLNKQLSSSSGLYCPHTDRVLSAERSSRASEQQLLAENSSNSPGNAANPDSASCSFPLQQPQVGLVQSKKSFSSASMNDHITLPRRTRNPDDSPGDDDAR